MPAPDTGTRRHRSDFFSALVALAVLATCAYYSFLTHRLPSFGFQLDKHIVVSAQPCAVSDEDCLRDGDQLLRVGSVDLETHVSSWQASFYRDLILQGGPVPIEVLRGGEVKTILWRNENTKNQTFSGFATVWLIPLLFWLMGALVALFVRPRGEQWLVLTLFFYSTAIWIAAGFVSATRLGYSMVVLHAAIWIFAALSIHLHLILPTPLFPGHRVVPIILYPLTAAFVALELIGILPAKLYILVALAAILLSITLIAIRLFLPSSPAARVRNRLMLFGVVLGLGPIVLLIISTLLRSAVSMPPTWLFLLIVPIWPLTYVYALYHHDFGTLQFRANRLLGTYGFWSFYIMLYVMTFLYFLSAMKISQEGMTAALLLSMGFVFVAPTLRAWFQREVDRRVFGIEYSAEEVISLFAERIPKAFDRAILRKIILNEVLPALMIRQSALYFFEKENSDFETICATPLPDDEEISGLEMARFLSVAGRFLPPERPDLDVSAASWVRLVVPLSIENRILGVWLFGRRDPDDYYPRSDIQLLTNLANLTAPVLEHVRLVEMARQEVEENKRLQEQLVQAHKMEAIGRLAAGVAHDFNNFLSVILGYCDLLIARYSKEYTLRKNLTAIKDAGTRAATLTRQLLAFSRQQVMEAKVVDFNAIVLEVAEILERLAGDEIEIRLRLGNDLPGTQLDPHQMGQVLINLVVNARDAMSSSGHITIETAAVEVFSDTSLPIEIPPGEYVVVRVSDDGPGISADIQTRIFEPFFTTKDVGKGTGLGLSMVYGVVRQSHGFIFLDSAPGSGATFHIYLPVIDQDEDLVASPPTRRRSLSLNGTETILVVEDEESVRKVAGKILQAKGYTVLQAEDGEEALRTFEAHDGPIHLLLTDVVMPQMRGPELAERLQRIQPDLKVIFMSGYNEEALPEKQLGALGPLLLQKPFSPQTLAFKVREILDRPGSSEVKTVGRAE